MVMVVLPEDLWAAEMSNRDMVTTYFERLRGYPDYCLPAWQGPQLNIGVYL
jgi:hypothetical protein